MYDDGLKIWKAECSDPAKLELFSEKIKNDPEAQFFVADAMLSEAGEGKNTSEAVYLMQRSANADYVNAVFAMGQMFRYGRGVHRSVKKAAEWYKKAEKLGSKEAAAELAELSRQKRKKIILIVCVAASAVVVAVLIVCVFANLRLMPGKNIKVNERTELIKTTSTDEFATEVTSLMMQYDDPQVVLGERRSNRVILKFEGEKLDLSEFLADKVVTRENNMVVIQFATDADAERCTDILKNTPGILYVERDSYSSGEVTLVSETGQSVKQRFKSQYSDKTYMSWGTIDMGLDKLDEWLCKNDPGNSVVVAVIDSGILPNPETSDRLLDGKDYAYKDESGKLFVEPWSKPLSGHGTHVSGSIIDSTQGLDIKILPVRVSLYGSSSCLALSLGIDYAVEHGADVINLSMGGYLHEQFLDDSVRAAIDAGTIFVTSAGNNSVDAIAKCPSHTDGCIVVSSYNTDREFSYSFSNFGNTITIGAPGEAILSYWTDDSNLDQMIQKYNLQKEDEKINKFRGGTEVSPCTFVEFTQGTSMSAPHVAALAAMLKLMRPDLSADQFKDCLADYSEDGGNKELFGYGFVDAGRFAGF